MNLEKPETDRCPQLLHQYAATEDLIHLRVCLAVLSFIKILMFSGF
jgi:hypothetical protein